MVQKVDLKEMFSPVAVARREGSWECQGKGDINANPYTDEVLRAAWIAGFEAEDAYASTADRRCENDYSTNMAKVMREYRNRYQ